MLTQFKQHKTLTFLFLLLLLILIFPFMEMSRIGSVFFMLLYTTVLLSGIYAISYDVRYVAIGIMLASPILVCQWSNVILNSPELDVLGKLCAVFFMGYILVALLERIFRARTVGRTEIYGSICAYLLIGLVFAYLYWLIETVFPDSFRFANEPRHIDAAPFLFFSFSALAGGGSDVSAHSPLARSLSLLEVLIGVIYVAVLIGRLISAMDMKAEEDRELVERHKREKEIHEFLRERMPLKNRPFGLVLSAVLLNFVASLLMIHLELPFFLDSWATSLAVMLGGWQAGAAVAVLYNLLIAGTYWGWSSWIWMFSSLTVVAATWFFMKRGWISIYKPTLLVLAGILTGMVNSVVAQLIIHFSNLPPYQGTYPVFNFFVKTTGNKTFAALAEKVFVEIADKTLSIVIAAVVIFLLNDLFQSYKKNLAGRKHARS